MSKHTPKEQMFQMIGCSGLILAMALAVAIVLAAWRW